MKIFDNRRLTFWKISKSIFICAIHKPYRLTALFESF